MTVPVPRSQRSETMLERYERLRQQREIPKHTMKSYEWFLDRTSRVGGEATRGRLFHEQMQAGYWHTSTPVPGMMYFYEYDAKTKEKLPYWDRFPLIFCVGPAQGGHYGLNLHYLHPKLRAILFDRLLDIANNDRFDNKTKLKLSYGVLKGAGKYKLFQPCFKHYLKDQMRSVFIKIPSQHWSAALFLPVQQFVYGGTGKGSMGSKANIRQIYNNSAEGRGR